jgi:hypothetical protein
MYAYFFIDRESALKMGKEMRDQLKNLNPPEPKGN